MNKNVIDFEKSTLIQMYIREHLSENVIVLHSPKAAIRKGASV